MVVFEAFPEAIETWSLGTMAYGTITGNKFKELNPVRVVVDEGDNSNPASAPNATTIQSDTLLYAMPQDLPTTNTSTLVADYAVKSPDGQIFAIIDAGAGKNQQRGKIEHIELKIRAFGAGEDAGRL